MITSVYCHITIEMRKGQVYDSRMYTAIEAGKGEKEHWRRLTQEQAGIAMKKLQLARKVKPEIVYNRFDSDLTSKEISYYWEK